jgi:hypothetical protein
VTTLAINKPNPTKPNQTQPNPTKPNQTQPNPTKPNQTQPTNLPAANFATAFNAAPFSTLQKHS